MKRTTLLLLSLVMIAGPSFAATKLIIKPAPMPVFRMAPIVVIAKREPKPRPKTTLVQKVDAVDITHGEFIMRKLG